MSLSDPIAGHNVYILGAGFSCESGYPTLKTFANLMRDSLPWLQADAKRTAEAKAIEDVLEYRLKAASAAYWTPLDLGNIEQLFSLASADPDGHEECVAMAIAATLDYVEKHRVKVPGKLQYSEGGGTVRPLQYPAWLKRFDPTQVGTSCSFKIDRYTHYLASMLGMYQSPAPVGENTVITFNYDSLVEGALRDLGVPWTYGVGENRAKFDQNVGAISEVEKTDSSVTRLLKLHGSINWGYLPKSLGPEWYFFRSYEELRQGRYEVGLIPPTWHKEFSGLFRTIWLEAVKAISRATRIMIVGFSSSPADQHFRFLLSAGLRGNAGLRSVDFINPSLDIRDKAAEIFDVKHIERGLVRFYPQTTASFADAASVHADRGEQILKPSLVEAGRRNATAGEFKFFL